MITGEVLAKSKSKSQSLYIARVLRSRSSCVKLTLSLHLELHRKTGTETLLFSGSDQSSKSKFLNLKQGNLVGFTIFGTRLTALDVLRFKEDT